jgi:hypothetical protein
LEKKIHNTEVVSTRVSGKFYLELWRRAENKHMSVSDYIKKALMSYTEWKEPVCKDGQE